MRALVLISILGAQLGSCASISYEARVRALEVRLSQLDADVMLLNSTPGSHPKLKPKPKAKTKPAKKKDEEAMFYDNW